MRVINPKLRQQPKPALPLLKRKPTFIRLALLAVIPIAFFAAGTQRSSSPESAKKQETMSNQNVVPAKPKTGKLKTFTAQQFRDMYNSYAYPNTRQINENSVITGKETVDRRLKEIAVKRGYVVRSAPVTNAFKDVGEGYLLQQRAARPWLDLKADAQKAGLMLGLTAAYRSADDQNQIFLLRMRQTGIPVDQIGSGAHDGQIAEILKTTAIPGYSRHHTGYTVDVSCKNQPGIAFEYTSCFQWLSANNYEKAKTSGWIPSYPKGAAEQGPEPESWEYVWVGKDILTE